MLSVGPQVATALLSTHFPPHTWKPLLHMRPQTPSVQAGRPFGSVGQVAQLVPQPVASLSGAHRDPQRWYPDPHVKSQVVPSHVVVSAPVGLGQDVHDVVPHESTLLFITQTPPQSWVPDGQTPEQAAAMSMQTPAHSFCPEGQLGTHMVPSHVTPPPVGAAHSEQELVPQLVVSVLLTQRPPQL